MKRIAGFTLIEVLIALTLMAVLTTMGWRTLNTLFQSAHGVQDHTQQAHELDVALTQWRDDLQAIASPSGTTPIQWDGKTLFATRRDDSNGRWMVVAWTMGDGAIPAAWRRWHSDGFTSLNGWTVAWQDAHSWSNNGAPSNTHTHDLLPMQEWKVFYYRNDSWSNPQSSVGNESLMPDGVRLTVQLPANHALAGTITVDWVREQLGAGS